MRKFRPIAIQMAKIILGLYITGLVLSHLEFIPADPMFFHFVGFMILLPIGIIGAAVLGIILAAIGLLILREVLKKALINRLLVKSGIWFIFVESTDPEMNKVAEINLLSSMKSKTRIVSQSFFLNQIHWRILYSISGSYQEPYLVDLRNKRTVYLGPHIEKFKRGKPAKLLKLKWQLRTE